MYKVIWSVDAELDYYNTLMFWKEHNKSSTYSEKLIQDVEKKDYVPNTSSELWNCNKLPQYI